VSLIRLIPDTHSVFPFHNPVENPHGLVISLIRSKPGPELDLILFGEFIPEPIQILVAAQQCEIISMRYKASLSVWMIEYTWIDQSLFEPDPCHELRV